MVVGVHANDQLFLLAFLIMEDENNDSMVYGLHSGEGDATTRISRDMKPTQMNYCSYEYLG